MIKYFLLNGKIPCYCTCHKECLERDLKAQGYKVNRLTEITKGRYDHIMRELEKSGALCGMQITSFR